MGKVVPSDQAKTPAGTYKIKFDRFTVRDNDVPVAKQTDRGLKLYFDLLIVDGPHQGELIPGSSDMESQLNAWVQLLTGKPPQTRDLNALERQLVAADKVVDMAVNDTGWARGPVVPKGAYLANFTGFNLRDKTTGKPIVGEGEYQGQKYPKVFWQFKITGGEYVGILVPASTPYAPKQRGVNLEISSKSNMFSWMVACGVDFAVMPDVADMSNALPELEQVMLKANAVVVIQVNEEGWIDSGQGAVAKAPSGMAPLGAPPVAEVKEADKVGDLYALMVKLCGQQKLGDPFATDGSLSDVGKAFAKEHVAPICIEHGIPKVFKQMSDQQAVLIMQELTKKFAVADAQSKAAAASAEF